MLNAVECMCCISPLVEGSRVSVNPIQAGLFAGLLTISFYLYTSNVNMISAW